MRQLVMCSLAVALVGCSKSQGSGAPAAPPEAPKPASVGEPAGAVAGTIAELLEVPGYTYLKLETGSGARWAAVPAAQGLSVGQRVTLKDGMPMRQFVSKALNRTFDEILFASGVEAGGAKEPAAAPPAHRSDDEIIRQAHADGAATPAPLGAPVAKASGPDAVTVEEVYVKRAALKDRTVTLRGAVVKYTKGVLGKNWLHVRDGSGSAAEHTDDVVVTTTAATSVGAVVTVRGALRLDRDLGSGYLFPVLIEDAQLLDEAAK